MIRRIVFLFVLSGLFASTLHAQTGTLQGRVASAEAPVPGANVVVQDTVRHDLERGASTDAEGRFRITSLPEGRYHVRVSAVGYEVHEERVHIHDGEATSLQVTLQPKSYSLGEIVVRGENQIAATPTTVQRVAPAELARQDASTVDEVMRLVPGAHVQTNSRGQTLVYLRDAGERQVAQFFDGALLNVPWDNRVDIGLMPTAMLEGITVSKGVPSVQYGTNVIGGAVNFRSRSMEQNGQRTEVSGALGTTQRRRASLLHMGRRGDVSYVGSMEYAHQGDFALPRDAGLSFSQPSSETRTNTDRRLLNGFARGQYHFGGGGRISVTGMHIEAEKGVAPESHVNPASGDVRYWRYPTWRKSMLIVSGEQRLGGGATLRGSAWGSRFEQDIHQYENVEYDVLKSAQNDNDLTGGLRLIWTQPAGPGVLTSSLNALTTRHRQVNVTYASGQPAPDSTSAYRQHLVSAGAEYETPLTDRLDATLGASLDGSISADIGPWAEVDSLSLENGSASYDASITGGFVYAASRSLSLRLTAGRKVRFPTMRERFGGALGKFLPNPDLRPVSAYLAEAGVSWGGTQFSGEATAFLNRTQDLIDKTTLESGLDQRINLDGSLIYGVELTGTTRPTDRLSLNGHFTWMRPRGYQDGETRKLDEKPAWLGKMTARYDLPMGLDAMAEAEYTAGAYARCRFEETSASAQCPEGVNSFVELPAALIVNARLSYQLNDTTRWLSSSEVFVRGNNLTDELRLLQLGLPAPGRSIVIGATIRM